VPGLAGCGALSRAWRRDLLYRLPMDLLVVGGGKMGEALVSGLLEAGWAKPSQVAVAEVSPERRAELTAPGGLASRFDGLEIVDGELPPADGVVLAVKPGDVEGVCRNLGSTGAKRVLSIAAGVTLSDLQSWCPGSCAVVRAMPNMPAVVSAAATAIVGGSRSDREDVDWAADIMSSVGLVVEVPERLLDAVTGLSGSGPAYIALVAEAMIEAGVLLGLPRSVAGELVVQTLLGTARMLAEPGQTPAALRAAVTSPAGTTASGLRELEAGGVRSAFIEAVTAASHRSRQLGSRGLGSPNA
jgi:pyrroline-5-carboxylate reductase